MLFHDRIEAGHALARALRKYRGQSPLILAIPRGAVPMGRAIAADLGGELDIVMVRKIGAPFNPEYALGAVDESGWVYRHPWAGHDPDTVRYFESEREVQLAVLRERRARYTPGLPPIDPAGRIVIVVDDGLATGSTMMAALHALRSRRPARLVCAVPVAPPEALAGIEGSADEVLCLHTPDNFQAVGQFYGVFDQVDDREVIEALRAARHTARRSPAQGVAAGGLSDGTVRMVLDDVTLEGALHLGDGRRMVVFAHGSGSSRHSPRNRQVAQVLNQAGIGTLLFDMLTVQEDTDVARRFDIELLTQRLLAVSEWLRTRSAGLSIGYFGASTGAAAALRAAAQLGAAVGAVVSRGGRPDLAGGAALRQVRCPTLLMVGSLDTEVLTLNQQAATQMRGVVSLVEIPGATHLFEEPGTLDQVAATACRWFGQYLDANPHKA